MRPLHLYLAIYVALVAGALLVLAQSGVLREVPVIWIVLGIAAAAAPALLLGLTSDPPAPPES